MAQSRPVSRSSAAAGLSGGTGFAGLILLLPEGNLKSIFLILSPSITILISIFWKTATDELVAYLDDWKLRRETRGAEDLVRKLEANPNASPELKAQAQSTLRAIMAAEVAIRQQRAQSIMKTSG